LTATAEANANAPVAAGISIDPLRTSNVVTGLGAERRCALFRLDRTTDDLDDGNPQLDDSFMDRFRKWSAIAGSGMKGWMRCASPKERRASLG